MSTLFPKTLDEMRARLVEIDRAIEAQDDFTDRHPYPSGMKRLRDLRDDRDLLVRRLAQTEETGQDPCEVGWQPKFRPPRRFGAW
jgi:hypothetical protein